MRIKKVLRRDEIMKFITRLYDGDLHAKRVLSLANATLGSAHQCVVGGACDWAGTSPGDGQVEQAWGEAG